MKTEIETHDEEAMKRQAKHREETKEKEHNLLPTKNNIQTKINPQPNKGKRTLIANPRHNLISPNPSGD